MAAWTAERFEHVDWTALERPPIEPGKRTLGRFVYARTLELWCAAENDPSRKEALEVLQQLLRLALVWEPAPDGPLAPRELLNRIPRDALAAIVANVSRMENPELRARVRDAAWIRRACAADGAVKAVDDYLECARLLHDPQHWLESFTHLQRAVHLAASLGRNGDAFARASAVALGLVRETSVGDPLYFSYRTIELLRSHAIGDAAELARLAESSAGVAVSAGEHHRAEEYLELAARCWLRADDRQRMSAARRRAAELLERQADAGGAVGHAAMQRVVFLERALTVYRTVGGANADISRVKVKLEQARAGAVAQFMRIEGPTIDLSEFAAEARRRVSGKDAPLALLEFVLLWHPPALEELHARAVQALSEMPLIGRIARETLDHSGRVLHRSPGGFGDDHESPVLAEMHTRLCADRCLFVRGGVLPALHQLQLEHGLRSEDMYVLARQSNFVPEGRAEAVARGLGAGLNRDFFTAAHILVPQFEHAVRHHLKQRGASTLTFPDSGIQDEVHLGRLLEMAEEHGIFDDVSAFDVKNLLTEKAGANLRNELAHGLIERGTQDDNFVYVWWVFLRFVMAPFAAGIREAEGDDGPSERPPRGGDADDRDGESAAGSSTTNARSSRMRKTEPTIMGTKRPTNSKSSARAPATASTAGKTADNGSKRSVNAKPAKSTSTKPATPKATKPEMSAWASGAKRSSVGGTEATAAASKKSRRKARGYE